MPEYRDSPRQQALLDAYEQALRVNRLAPRPPDLDPDLAAVAEVLARQFGGPLPDPAVAPDPAFRLALRDRLAERARGDLIAPNGVAHSQVGSLVALDTLPSRPERHTRRGGVGPGQDILGTPIAPTLPAVPPIAPPARSAPGRWRGGWTMVSGGLGRVGTALLLVAIVVIAVVLLRPTPNDPGGRGASPGIPTATASALPGVSATPGPVNTPPPTIAPTPVVAPPRWQATGVLPAPRADHTATRLADGRVLVAGGITPDTVGGTATSALYDPQTGRWSPSGTMVAGRVRHAAVLLRDGRVLVAGGYSDNADPAFVGAANAELYDPASGTWRAVAAPPRPAGLAVATSLADGRALVIAMPTVGTPPNMWTIDAFVYDPTADRWASFGPTGLDELPVVVALRDGRALVLGAADYENDGTTPALLLDPVTGRMTAAPLPGARNGATLSALLDGRVIVVGGASLRRGSDGVTTATPLGSTALYDPTAGTWSEGAGLTTPRSRQEATTLSDGRVLIVGGNTNDGQSPITAELYDPQSRTWTALGEVGGKTRRAFAVAPLADGRALVVGGDAGFVRSEWLAEVRLLSPPAAPRVSTREGSGAATPGATPGAVSGIGKWDTPTAGVLFYGGRGYRVREQTLPDGTVPQLGAQIGTTLLPWQSGGVFPAGVAIYAVAGQAAESWLAIRDGVRIVLYRQDDNTTAQLAGFQIVVATSASDGETVCPTYDCPTAGQAQPGTVATANRVVVERTLQGSVAAGTTIEIRQMGLPGTGPPNQWLVALPPGQRVLLFLQPAQRQSIGDFAGGEYYWTGPGWVYGFIDDQVVPLGGSGGVQIPLDRFEAAIRELFAAVTPRAPTDPVPTPRPVPTPTARP